MLGASKPILLQAALKIKPSKDAVSHARISGNNWCKGRNNDLLEVRVQPNDFPFCKSHDCHNYLGKSLSSLWRC